MLNCKTNFYYEILMHLSAKIILRYSDNVFPQIEKKMTKNPKFFPKIKKKIK